MEYAVMIKNSASFMQDWGGMIGLRVFSCGQSLSTIVAIVTSIIGRNI
ncbi:MAG: hypothetical protein GY754_27080 [bacterium]|nr:hypothetical protein [bacterium]